MAKYFVKVNFNPLFSGKNINHTHHVLEAERNRGTAYFDYFETI